MHTKTKNIMKIALDILMALVFAILFNKTALGGMAFHEIAGLAIGAFIIIHMIQNRAWLKGVTKKLFNPKLPTRTRVAYIVDVLLLTAIAVIIITGILMSRVVFANLISVHLNVSGLHKAVSYIALALIGAHIGLSWNRVVTIVKKLLHIPQRRALGAVATLCAVIVFSLGSYNIVSTGYIDKVGSVTSGYSQFGEGEHSFAGKETPDGAVLSEPNSGRGSGNGNGNGKMHGGGGQGSANVLMTIYQNLSIVAAFAVFIFYIDKLFRKKPKKTEKDTSNYGTAPVE